MFCFLRMHTHGQLFFDYVIGRRIIRQRMNSKSCCCFRSMVDVRKIHKNNSIDGLLSIRRWCSCCHYSMPYMTFDLWSLRTWREAHREDSHFLCMNRRRTGKSIRSTISLHCSSQSCVDRNLADAAVFAVTHIRRNIVVANVINANVFQLPSGIVSFATKNYVRFPLANLIQSLCTHRQWVHGCHLT